MASTESKLSEFALWDEDQCHAALGRLEQLRDQLDELRLSIPAIIEPLTTTGINAQEHFRRFKEAAQSEHSRHDRFRATWHSGPIAEALEYTSLSRKQGQTRPNGVRLPKYGWNDDHDPINRGTDKQEEVNGDSNGSPGSQTEDTESVVKAFQQRHPECHIDSYISEQKIQIAVPAPLGPISFTIKKRERPQNEGPRWDVECLGSMTLYLAITRCLASRPNGNDLNYTLEMIAAYKDARRAPCMTCGKMVDKTMQTAPARRSKTVKTEDGKSQDVWEAFHEGCLR
ncbi:hypothetical protein EV356DRAFT_534571 [Viridothelium virens]|uniref:Uncharacterized protein n=1 Tax=Viridothelium virens TaxID=1048519 RepID=A0A6A6H2Y8_VIRVR|nr:hypothetical protein EV356DRAFT_534571 [Viridothelium virens]